jgi:hypothetical protein
MDLYLPTGNRGPGSIFGAVSDMTENEAGDFNNNSLSHSHGSSGYSTGRMNSHNIRSGQQQGQGQISQRSSRQQQQQPRTRHGRNNEHDHHLDAHHGGMMTDVEDSQLIVSSAKLQLQRQPETTTTINTNTTTDHPKEQQTSKNKQGSCHATNNEPAEDVDVDTSSPPASAAESSAAGAGADEHSQPLRRFMARFASSQRCVAKAEELMAQMLLEEEEEEDIEEEGGGEGSVTPSNTARTSGLKRLDHNTNRSTSRRMYRRSIGSETPSSTHNDQVIPSVSEEDHAKLEPRRNSSQASFRSAASKGSARSASSSNNSSRHSHSSRDVTSQSQRRNHRQSDADDDRSAVSSDDDDDSLFDSGAEDDDSFHSYSSYSSQESGECEGRSGNIPDNHQRRMVVEKRRGTLRSLAQERTLSSRSLLSNTSMPKQTHITTTNDTGAATTTGAGDASLAAQNKNGPEAAAAVEPKEHEHEEVASGEEQGATNNVNNTGDVAIHDRFGSFSAHTSDNNSIISRDRSGSESSYNSSDGSGSSFVTDDEDEDEDESTCSGDEERDGDSPDRRKTMQRRRRRRRRRRDANSNGGGSVHFGDTTKKRNTPSPTPSSEEGGVVAVSFPEVRPEHFPSVEEWNNSNRNNKEQECARDAERKKYPPKDAGAGAGAGAGTGTRAVAVITGSGSPDNAAPSATLYRDIFKPRGQGSRFKPARSISNLLGGAGRRRSSADNASPVAVMQPLPEGNARIDEDMATAKQEDGHMEIQYVNMKLELACLSQELDETRLKLQQKATQHSQLQAYAKQMEEQENLSVESFLQMQKNSDGAQVSLAELQKITQTLLHERVDLHASVNTAETALKKTTRDLVLFQTVAEQTEKRLGAVTKERDVSVEQLQKALGERADLDMKLKEATRVIQMMKNQAMSSSIERNDLWKQSKRAEFDQTQVQMVAQNRANTVTQLEIQVKQLKTELKEEKFQRGSGEREPARLSASSARNNTNHNSGNQDGPDPARRIKFSWIANVLFPPSRRRRHSTDGSTRVKRSASDNDISTIVGNTGTAGADADGGRRGGNNKSFKKSRSYDNLIQEFGSSPTSGTAKGGKSSNKHRGSSSSSSTKSLNPFQNMSRSIQGRYSGSTRSDIYIPPDLFGNYGSSESINTDLNVNEQKNRGDLHQMEELNEQCENGNGDDESNASVPLRPNYLLDAIVRSFSLPFHRNKRNKNSSSSRHSCNNNRNDHGDNCASRRSSTSSSDDGDGLLEEREDYNVHNANNADTASSARALAAQASASNGILAAATGMETRSPLYPPGIQEEGMSGEHQHRQYLL